MAITTASSATIDLVTIFDIDLFIAGFSNMQNYFEDDSRLTEKK
jgi:hypothetical protein